jgi:hypothetical protein
MEISEVTSLPALEQSDFLSLPEVREGATLVCCDTEWKNAEKEFAAGCIVTACIRAKQWQPVHAQQFVDCVREHPLIPPPMAQRVASALWVLVTDGYLEAVRYSGVTHFVPTPRLAHAVLADRRKLRVA